MVLILATIASYLAELVSMLALAVVLSGYERRTMSMLHNRDAPVVYLLLGLGQPIGDAGKLVSKSMVVLYHYGYSCLLHGMPCGM